MTLLRRWGIFVALLMVALIAGLAAGPDAGGVSTLPTVDNRGPQGLAVLATWMREAGVSVSVLKDPWTGFDPALKSLVLVEPAAREVTKPEMARLQEFVRAGGTLVLLLPRALDRQSALAEWLGLESGERQPFDRGTPSDVAGATATVQLHGGLTARVNTLRVSAGRGWRCTGPGLVPVDSIGALCFHPEGEGEVWVGAGADLAENRRLDLADNLRFWAALAARGPLAFDESHLVAALGPSLTTNLWATWAQCLFVAAIFLIARMRRLGPPRPSPQIINRSSLEYVRTLGALTAEAGVEVELVGELHKELRRALHERLGLGVELPAAVVAQELERTQRCTAAEFSALDERLVRGSRAANTAEYLALSADVARLLRRF